MNASAHFVSQLLVSPVVATKFSRNACTNTLPDMRSSSSSSGSGSVRNDPPVVCVQPAAAAGVRGAAARGAWAERSPAERHTASTAVSWIWSLFM